MTGFFVKHIIWAKFGKQLNASEIPPEFTELFNHHIFRLYEMGVMDRLKHKYVDKPNEDFGFPEAIALGYENLLFPFGFIALGAILASVVIVGEHIFGRITKLDNGMKFLGLRPKNSN